MTKRLLRRERGTAMVEFAIVMPVLIFLVIGVIEVGRFAYFGILAAHAAQSGISYGAQNTATADDSTDIASAVLKDGQSLGWNVSVSHTCKQSGVVVTCPTAEPTAGTVYYLTVQVSATFHPLLNYPGIPSSLPVSATVTQKVSYQ